MSGDSRLLSAAVAAIATVATVAIASSVGARARRARDIRPKAPELPRGWRRYRGKLTEGMRNAALIALGQDKPVGSVVPLVIDGKHFGAFIEWHEDRKRGRHRGVSLVVPAP